MTQVILYQDKLHPTIIPSSVEFEKTLKRYRKDYDKKLIRVKRKLNTWDNPNSNYIKKKDRK